jgi:hypothetical protein
LFLFIPVLGITPKQHVTRTLKVAQLDFIPLQNKSEVALTLLHVPTTHPMRIGRLAGKAQCSIMD